MITGQLIYTLSGHKNAIFSVAISSDNGRVVTGSNDGDAKVWDMKAG